MLTIPINGATRDITVAFTEVPLHLVVTTTVGMSDPAAGEHVLASDAVVTITATAPDPTGGVRAVCTGWTGTGSVPETGTETNVTFTIMEDSSIIWIWATGYWVDFTIVGKGTTSYVAQWIAEGSNLEIPFAVNTPFYSLMLSGDTDGAVLGNSSVTVPVTAPRSLVLTVTEYTYESALDEGRLAWKSGGSSVWVPQATVSHDREDSVRSGEVLGDDVSTLSTIVVGSGTLSWWWRLDMSDCAGVEVFVDNLSVASLDVAGDWSSESVAISGDGEHIVRFEFWNAGTAAHIADCVYLDQVSWTGQVPSTQTTPVPVPHSWLDRYGLASGGDYEAAARSTAANGINAVWQCYVAGLDPENANDPLVAHIAMRPDGTPDVSWTPVLPPAEAALRTYTIKGKLELDDPVWIPVAAGEEQNYHFFIVTVEMK